MNKKNLNFVTIIFLILLVGFGSYSFGRRCWCYDEEEAKGECAFKEEYMFSRILSAGRCIGPGCEVRVEVTCKDTDAGGKKYKKEYISWDGYCNDCFR